MAIKKKVFQSNVAKEHWADTHDDKASALEWNKESHLRWDKVIGRIGVLIKDEVHISKTGDDTLKAGTKVVVNDLRGRVLPQYRVKDPNGRVWFVSTTNVEFIDDFEIEPDFVENKLDKSWSASDKKIWRYDMPITTKEEIQKQRELKLAQKKRERAQREKING
jgi:hypothetical protein